MKSNKIPTTNITSRYDILFIVNDKGGSRKSTLLIFLLAILIMARLGARVFEIDDQGRVARLYKGLVSTLVLPDADTLSKSAMGDTAVLASMLSAITAPANDAIILIEVGANLAERVAFALKANLVSTMLVEGTRIGIVVPIDGSDDSIALGARSAALIQRALPTADMIIVQPQELLFSDSAMTRLSPEAKKGLDEVIAPAVRSSSPLIWPQMSPDLRHAFEAMRLNPVEMINMDDASVGKAAYDSSRMSFQPTEDSVKWMGRRLKTELHLYLGSLMQETQRLLGFPIEAQ